MSGLLWLLLSDFNFLGFAFVSHPARTIQISLSFAYALFQTEKF